MSKKRRIGLKTARPSRQEMWQEGRRWFLVFVGVTIAALGYVVFLVPHKIAAGGISGISILINHFTGLPVGTMFFVLNVPLLILGFFHLGRWPFLLRTLFASATFAIATDLFVAYLPLVLPQTPLSDDLLLSAIYGGIVGGIGGGLIYRAGGTMGGTGIIGRIIQNKTGKPLSQTYFYTDGMIILLAAIVFGWEVALYALLTLFLNGLASDYTLEGPSSTRTATIVTGRPQEMVAALMQRLNRGVSYWEITGGYTGQARYLVSCTVYRPQVNELKRVVADVDGDAFLTIGISHQALGGGFQPLRPRNGHL